MVPRLAFVLIAALYAEAGGIGQCPQPDGSTLFTNLGCPDGSPPDPAVIQSPHSYLDMRLPKIRHAPADRNRPRKSPDARQDRAIDECAEARGALAALRAKRRKGYRLAQTPDLDMQEAQLKRDRRRHC